MKRLASGWWVKAMCSISELFLELKIHDTTPFLVPLVGNDRYLLFQRPLLDGLDGPVEDLHSLPLGWIPDLSLFSLAAEITVNPHSFRTINKHLPRAEAKTFTHTAGAVTVQFFTPPVLKRIQAIFPRPALHFRRYFIRDNGNAVPRSALALSSSFSSSCSSGSRRCYLFQ